MQIKILFLVFLIGSMFNIGFASDKPKVKLLTYNVLADPISTELRIPALLAILKNSDADIIALQEVSDWFIELLLKEKWISAYHFTKQDGKVLAPRGLLLLSKTPIKKTTWDFLPSRQKRAYLFIETEINGFPFHIATCHLDSFLEDGPKRAEQLKWIFDALKPFENSILLGDLNFGDREEPESKTLPADYEDLWLKCKPKDPGYTWNIQKSLMAKNGSFPGEPSRRIDRILVKSKKVSPEAVAIVGDKALDANREVFPSDHFGLLGEIIFDR